MGNMSTEQLQEVQSLVRETYEEVLLKYEEGRIILFHQKIPEKRLLTITYPTYWSTEQIVKTIKKEILKISAFGWLLK